MTTTAIPYGAPQAISLQSVALFSACMQRLTILNRLAGKMPTQDESEDKLRFHTSNDYPIVRCKDLSRGPGDEIKFDLVQPIGGKPIMGAAYAEGNGDPMDFAFDSLRINQYRKPISGGDSMSQQRTPHQLRKLARAQALNFIKRYEDQSALVHLAGARGSDYNIEWAVPLTSDPDFSSIMINPVRAPTRNRHYLASSGSLKKVVAAGNEITIASTDTMTADVIDALRTKLDSMPLPPQGVRFDGDQAADDAPLRVLLVSSEQYTSIVQSTNFRTFQANAMARAGMAKNHPIFMGEAGLWNGILIVKMPKPIRFFAGDSLRWCASTSSLTETATDLVPAAFGTTFAIDRAILLGGQALGEAFGKARKSGDSYFWSEKELDHDDKLEVLVGGIGGKSKIRYLMDFGSGMEYTDHGVIAIDTAVRLVP
ncbi:MAG: N4-gp56 family major capsid protein [Accumulibacter sp.]|jgi:N4-gp56 family major capsid protein|uniref:N4-gp56 family major capsid protein n=1 Tax=Accumulibacter sp. TaxID=2053492 RepID=UPI002FC360F6